jgi:ATP-dependent RNA helicase DeaD
MLKTIEQVTGSPIAVGKLPTVADLRARRLELTQAALRESLLEDDLDRFRAVVETLTDEFDVVDVALAAVKLAHEAGGGTDDDEEDIPDVPLRPERSDARRPDGRGRRDDRRGPSANTARIFLGLGRSAGVRPGDLVGAITGEAGLRGRDIGAIEIADRFSVVEVPEQAAREVIAALREATIRGRRPTVRRDRDTRG